MGREIKFRAWNKYDKTMHHQGDEWDNALGEPLTWYEVFFNGAANMEIMQFTGLHDKNGVDVWESDIVLFGDEPYKIKLTVSWVGAGFNIVDVADGIHLEVIGNIHQPELIKGVE